MQNKLYSKYGSACTCNQGNRRGDIADFRIRYWRVRQRYCNHSYFQKPKGGKHYSDYSTIICQLCNNIWRTKAKYVYSLEDE